MRTTNYDVVIMVTKKNIPLLEISYEYLKSNLGADNIFFIGNKGLEKEIKKIGGFFIDEDKLMNGLQFSIVKEIIEKRGDYGKRTGWYFQQFLKMAYAYKATNEYYLVWDADTVPLCKINYFSNEGRPAFTIKKEYHLPYFITLGRLFEGTVERMDKNISFIAENMMIDAKVMKEIIEKIESNYRISGTLFFEKIINSIDETDLPNSGFSEFETYGNYIEKYYPNKYGYMKYRTQRLGSILFGNSPTKEQLEWASNDYDIISFETANRGMLPRITKIPFVRECFSAAQIFIPVKKMRNFVDKMSGKKVIDLDE